MCKKRFLQEVGNRELIYFCYCLFVWGDNFVILDEKEKSDNRYNKGPLTNDSITFQCRHTNMQLPACFGT